MVARVRAMIGLGLALTASARPVSMPEPPEPTEPSARPRSDTTEPRVPSHTGDGMPLRPAPPEQCGFAHVERKGPRKLTRRQRRNR